MSTERAVFINQLLTIEAETQSQGGSCLTISSPVNEPNYMNILLEAVQGWTPPALAKGGSNSESGGQIPIATDARIENSQVICSLTPQSGTIDGDMLGRQILPGLVRHLETHTVRAMSAMAGEGTGPGLRGDVETRGA